MNCENRQEAIVLGAIPFQDAHQIVTLFTKDQGLCRGFASYSRSPKSGLFGMLNPLAHIEVIFRPSKGDLLKIMSAFVIRHHRELRKSYDRLQLSCQMATSLSQFQLPHKPAPLLFDLFKSYLALIGESAFPQSVLASFQLKLLRHEGLIAVTNRCPLCNAEPEEIALAAGKTICSSHEEASIVLDREETAYFYALALSTSSKLIQEIDIEPPLFSKIQAFFKEHVE